MPIKPDALADDITERLAILSLRRNGFESVWQQVADVAVPDAKDFRTFAYGSGSNIANWQQLPMAARRSKNIYDSTAVTSVDRLGSILEALVAPQSEFWHSYDLIDFSRIDGPSDEEKLWIENLRNLVFKIRYDGHSGWIASLQTALRHMVAFGNAFVFVEDNLSPQRITDLIHYRYLPLVECYADENANANIDTFYRYYSMTARQAYQKFGEKLTPAIIKAAQDKSEMDRPFPFIHAIQPRQDFGDLAKGVKGSKYESVYVDAENRAVVGRSGYFEFPIIPFRWLPEPGRVWGEGPLMKALSDVQSLNMMAKNELVASQQAVDPPLLVANAGVMNRPNSNPGAVNLGGLNGAGQELIKPFLSQQRLDFATAVLEAKRNQVKDSLYINLFQILVKNPQMSATEAMIRANEKGELLGPAGARLQDALAFAIERELAILARRGVFQGKSKFRPPSTVANADVKATFSSPITRLRRAKEGEGTLRTLEVLSPLAQIDPNAIAVFNAEEMARGLAEINGMPQKFLHSREEFQKIQAQRAQQQQMAQQAAVAKDMAAAGAQGSQALQNMGLGSK